MANFEILLNGEKVCMAGVDAGNDLSANVYITAGWNKPFIVVSGDYYDGKETQKTRMIFGRQRLFVGDEVGIRIVDHAQVDEPIESFAVNYTKESEEFTNKVIEKTAELWLEAITKGDLIPLKCIQKKVEDVQRRKNPEPPDQHYCSFCGSAVNEVDILIAGPGVFICDSCVELCTDILEQAREEAAQKERGPSLPADGQWPRRDE